jgi:glycerophosphoryl diester phosphodiesterase
MTMVVAHRGLWADQFVENSVDAFSAAAAAGFPVECDVQASADGEPVVIHDPTLERTTTGSGFVSSFTCQQLRDFRLRGPFVPAEQGGPLPMLADVAHLVTLVEVKPPDSPELVRRVIRLMAGRNWVLQSFDPRNLVHAEKADPSVQVALLAEDAGGVDIAIERRWPLHLHHRLLDDRIMHCLHAGALRVGVWTVNEEPDIRRMLLLAPDLIISDRPHLVRQMVGSRQRGQDKPN